MFQVVFGRCCCRVNTKRGNYVFGLANLVSALWSKFDDDGLKLEIFRFAALIPLHVAIYLDDDVRLRIIFACAFGWCLVSVLTCAALIAGIWTHQPMYTLPFVITVFCETLATGVGTVGLTSLYGYHYEWIYLILGLTFGVFVTGAYCYYGIVLYVMYKSMLSNPLARYVYIS